MVSVLDTLDQNICSYNILAKFCPFGQNVVQVLSERTERALGSYIHIEMSVQHLLKEPTTTFCPFGQNAVQDLSVRTERGPGSVRTDRSLIYRNVRSRKHIDMIHLSINNKPRFVRSDKTRSRICPFGQNVVQDLSERTGPLYIETSVSENTSI